MVGSWVPPVARGLVGEIRESEEHCGEKVVTLKVVFGPLSELGAIYGAASRPKKHLVGSFV